RVREEMVPKIQALTGGARSSPGRPPTAPLATIAQVATTTPIPKTTPLATIRTPVPPSSTRTIPLPRMTTQVIARSQITASNPVIVLDGPIRLHRATGPRPPTEVIAIGASTGGPNALAELLAQLPEDFPVPIVIVQHMLATFTRHFAERLAAQCRIKIVEANE